MHKKNTKLIAQKTLSIFVSLVTVVSSTGLPFMFPQTALAAALSATAGGPPNGQQGAPVEALVDEAFNNALNPSTAATSTVSLMANTGNVQGGAPTGQNLCTSVSLADSNYHIICNHDKLSTGTWYTFTITTSVQDMSASHLSSNFVSQFQTGTFSGGAAFNPPPMIVGTNPSGGQNFPVNGKIVVNFSTNMRTDGAGSVLAPRIIVLEAVTNGIPTPTNLITESNQLSWDSTHKQLKVTPPTLTVGSYYKLLIPADNDSNPGNNSCGDDGQPACVIDTDGLALPGSGPYEINFRAIAADNTPPTVSGSFPEDQATGVDRALQDFAISFNEALDPIKVSTSTVELWLDANNNKAVDIGTDSKYATTTVALDTDGRVIHLSSNTILPANTNFIIRLTKDISDIIGNHQSSNDTAIRTFTTGDIINGTATDTTAPQVMFANADNYSIAVTFSEAMKSNATSSAALVSSSGSNDVNNLSNWTVETAPSGDTTHWMKNPLNDKQVKYEPYNKTLMIMGLAIPPAGNFRVTSATSTQDLAGNAIDATKNIAQGTVKSTTQTGGMLEPGQTAGAVDYSQMGTQPVSASPATSMAGATSRYHIEFPADTAIAGASPNAGKITLSFPAGFSFTTACNTWPTDTFENSDINGPATGTVVVSSIACDSVSGTATVTLGSTGIQAGDMLRFNIQGVVNSTVPKDFSSSGYSVDIKTYNASNALLDSKTTMPFFIGAPGSGTISGTVSAGGTGISNIQVCLSGSGIGYQCANTNGSGSYAFTNLNNGFYHLEIPPMTSGNYTGGPFARDINLSGNDTNENFSLQQASSSNIFHVYIGGSGLNGTKIDVFAFSSSGAMNGSGGSSGSGGSVVRECTIGTDCDAVALPLMQGKWQVGVGPWMPKDTGNATSVPNFTFMPPKSVDVEVTASGVPDMCTSGTGAAEQLCFDLAKASNQIQGKVIDGSGGTIQNVFINARPAFMNDANGPSAAGVGQSDSAGLFNVNVVAGTYMVDASMPGMPPSTSVECTVKTDTDNGATDGNSTADVYCNGNLVTAGNPLIIKIAKGDTSISGRVLDDSNNPISYAHVEATQVDSDGNSVGASMDTPTDSSGNYTLYVSGGDGASPKQWKLRAFAPGFGELNSITVSVIEGSDLTDENITATTSDFGTVTGSVKQGGTGVSGAFVGVHGACGGNGTITDASGNYSLKLKATGSCTATVGDDESYTIEGFVPGQGPTTSLSGINVTGGQTLSGKNLTIAQAGQITAYVCVLTNPSAAPSAANGCVSRKVSTAFIDARDSTGKGNNTSSNPTAGQYDLIIPAGTYTVFAGDPNIGPIGSQANVTVAANTTTYVNIVPPVLYQVSGTVTSANSACIEGSTVFMSDKTNGRVILSRVDSSGNWSQGGVPNGTYSIGAGKPGCVDSTDPGTLTVNGANAVAVARTLTKADATVSGHVTLNSSNVTFPAMVVATSGTGKMAAAQVDTSQTTGNNYTLNLTAGTWTFKARSDGYESNSPSVALTSGGSQTLNLTLSAIAGYTRKEPQPFTMKPSQGGVVTNPDISDNFQVNIPAGALGSSSNDGSILTKETTSVVDTGNQKVLGGKGIEITPKDASGQPITTLSSSSGSGATITIPYSEADVTAAGGTENQIVIGSWSDEKQQWDPLPTTCDTTNNICTATTSHFSTFATIVATSGGAPSTPAGLSAAAASTTGINLSWTQTSGATSYDIYRSATSGGTFARIGTEPTVSSGSTTSYGDTGLTASTTYYYEISALNASGESAASSEVSGTTSATSAAASGSHSGSIGGGSSLAKAKEIIQQEKPVTAMTAVEITAKIAQIQTLITSLQAQLAALTGQTPAAGIPAGFKFAAKLKLGMRSLNVQYLQSFLKSQGPDIYPEGLITGFYGAKTAAAVARFQEKFASEILQPFGLANGTGIFGEKTMQKVNSLIGK